MLDAANRKVLNRGILIAIEGIDGAGKTTQSQLLIEKLSNQGYPTVCLHEPTDGKWGQKIREIAKGGRKNVTPEEELNLFYQDRLEDVDYNINPALTSNNVVLMDRYYFSSIAYQGARGLETDKIEKMNEFAPEPDLLLILDLKPAVALKRIKKNRTDGPNEFEKNKHLEKSRDIFLKCFAKRPYTRIIEANGRHSPQEISENIWSIVQPILLANEKK